MAKGKRVFVGLSGGVDSAVSAALLKKEGYDVVGLFVSIVLEGYPCSALEDRREALRVAAHLDIPFQEIDLSEEYRKRVFEVTLEDYQRGETPNPDALCNREIKFGLMYQYARAQGADFLATGHYARTHLLHGEAHLLSGKDEEKDQSYFLWMLGQEELSHALFPVGSMHKSEVRALAHNLGLPNAARKDSQGLCFLGPLSMEDVLSRELSPQQGAVLDEYGSVIGTHRGALLYTIGQRHGFEISARSSHEVPHYVIEKDVLHNTLTVSTERGASGQGEIVLHQNNWIGNFEDGVCEARFRYRQPLIGATLRREKHKTGVTVDTGSALPRGQSLVLYRGERCLGGGVI
ncbi:MAG: tRNA 2-thiouridine(34) synthase MnmA [Patescibacteria group bacterium]|nr:tRNA 2-thiouridine(34) synthase MnmA [Patescibacteria group bacterium]